MKKGLLSLSFIVSSFVLFAQETGLTPNQGFSLNSFLRGVLGMVVLLAIALALSTNRKAINWKTVGIGLTAQLLIAIGVLKVNFIKRIFESIGGVFNNVLEYTGAGSSFLFGNLMNVDSFGFIFIFQIMPTIIFFAAF